MLSFLPGPILGVLTLGIGLVNITFWFTMFIPVILVRFLIPLPAVRRACKRLLESMVETWADLNMAIFRSTQKTEWDIDIPSELRREGSYLVVSNHQGWMDIVLLQGIFNHRIPILKFLLKRELLYAPIVGMACWALDFPFMRRHPHQFLRAHPERRRDDLATLRHFCERYRNVPTVVMNFAEGTRFTPEKHRRRRSPHKHLLRPRAGGVGYVLAAMGSNLEAIIDVTVHYPEGAHLWDFARGRWPRVVVRARALPVPVEFVGADYASDSACRARMRAWIDNVWAEKDALLEQLSKRTYAVDSTRQAPQTPINAPPD